MNNDQEMIAWLGLVLVLIVLWTVYRTTIKAILFDSPAMGSTGAPLSGASVLPDILNPLSTLNRSNPLDPLHTLDYTQPIEKVAV